MIHVFVLPTSKRGKAYHKIYCLFIIPAAGVTAGEDDVLVLALARLAAV